VAGADTTHDAPAAAEATRRHDAGGHGHADHGSASDGGHDAEHAQAPLGPVDWRAWGFALLGAAAAGVIALSLYLASTASS
jgi:hypothetical protein